MSEIAIDPELLSDFIIEAKELLDEFNGNVIDLERRPRDADTVGAIFRAAHTLKGSSAFFNLTHIKNFSHKLENLLDEIRNRTREVTPEVIDILLYGGNHLKEMFERVRAGDYRTVLSPDEEKFLTGLLAYMEQPPKVTSADPADLIRAVAALTADYRKSGLDPAGVLENIETLVSGFRSAVPGGAPSATVGVTCGPAETAYIYRGIDLTGPVKIGLEAFEQATSTGNLEMAVFDRAVDELGRTIEKNGLTELKGPFIEMEEDYLAVRDSAVGFDALLIGLIREKWNNLIERLETVRPADTAVNPPIEPAEVVVPPDAAPPEQPSSTTRPETGKSSGREEKTERKTMRIDEEKVDGFMNYVGELIVTAESFNHVQKMIESQKVDPITVRAFKNTNQAFRELSGKLQESLMEVRRVPVKPLLRKIEMMSRELSHSMRKKVRGRIEGEEVQVDKSIAERLEGPLVHVVRNSLDHGLEQPEERFTAGKPEEGLIQVAASADREFFYLSVMDDGRGIDPDKMREAAVAKGLMNRNQANALSVREARNLIFEAGFSTAREITDVSGRGVGMDVVRTNIDSLNGSISLDSEVGRGTTITFKIPLSVTLQVIKALLVRVGLENFIISLDDVLESLRPRPEDLTTVKGRGEVFTRRGQLLPLIRLHEVFDIEPQVTDPSKSILVVIDNSMGRFGLMVDEVLGQQQVVVKEMDDWFKNLGFLTGSATLGDGRLGLVLDTQGVVRLARGQK